MKLYALMNEEYDSYDVGTHLELCELFADRAVAEQVIAGLVGKQRYQLSYSTTTAWRSSDFEIQEYEVR